MNVNKQKVIKYLKAYSVPPYDPEKLQETIELGKDIYMRSQTSARIGLLKFILYQFSFISKWVWALQLALLIIVFLATEKFTHSINSIQLVFAIFSSSTPLIAFFGIPELLKSYSYSMYEIEGCTRFSMYKLMGARMLIIGLADLCCLTVILTISIANIEVPIERLILYLLVPFNVTCCCCLAVLLHVKSNQGGYACAGICVFFIVLFTRLSFIKEIYETAVTGVWAIMFICSLIGFTIETIRTLQATSNIFCVKKDSITIPW